MEEQDDDASHKVGTTTIVISAIGFLSFGALGTYAYISSSTNPDWKITATLFSLAGIFLIVPLVIHRLSQFPLPWGDGPAEFSDGGTQSTPVETDQSEDQPDEGTSFEEVLSRMREESTDLADIVGEIRRQSEHTNGYEALTEFLESAIANTEGHIEGAINELDQQIAVKKYRDNVQDPRMDIMYYASGTIRARAKEEATLTKGMRFNVQIRDHRLNEDVTVGVAELTEPNSTSGTLYELEIVKWGGEGAESREEIEHALETERGKIDIQRDKITDIDIDRLEEMRDSLSRYQTEKEGRELSYAT